MSPSRPGSQFFAVLMGVIVVAGLIVWSAADFFSSFAATRVATHTHGCGRYRKSIDVRVTRAFAATRRNKGGEVTLATERNPKQQTRDAVLTITAPTEREALKELAETTRAMQAAFAEGGGGELYDVGNKPRARWVPNAQTILLARVCRWGGLLLIVGGLALMSRHAWRLRVSPAE